MLQNSLEKGENSTTSEYKTKKTKYYLISLCKGEIAKKNLTFFMLDNVIMVS